MLFVAKNHHISPPSILDQVTLYEGRPMQIISTYTEAVQTVDPLLANGKPHMLWVDFAKFYEKHDQIKEARIIFEKAVKVGIREQGLIGTIVILLNQIFRGTI